MTDIRTRIAAAIMQTCHGVYMDDAVNAADAVIRELGLKRASRPSDYGKPDQWVRRHVTDWEIVDE